MIRKAFGFAAFAWLYDVCARPASAARHARRYCDDVKKPMLNVGCGTSESSFRVFLLGPVLMGDVNLDLSAPRDRRCEITVAGVGTPPCYGDAMKLPYPDKYFGAVLASHILEHVDSPDVALREWQRVADRVYVIVPVWWAPHTWMQLGHKWFITQDLSKAKPLWGNYGESVRLLS